MSRDAGKEIREARRSLAQSDFWKDLRPPVKGRTKHETDWVLRGTWGEETRKPKSTSDFHREIQQELIEDGVLTLDSPQASIKHRQHVTLEVMKCSRIDGRWVRDEPFADRLKRLRDEAKLTKEQLSKASGLDLGTIRQLEQGTRTNPRWATICALAAGLKKPVTAFLGTVVAAQPEDGL